MAAADPGYYAGLGQAGRFHKLVQSYGLWPVGDVLCELPCLLAGLGLERALRDGFASGG